MASEQEPSPTRSSPTSSSPASTSGYAPGGPTPAVPPPPSGPTSGVPTGGQSVAEDAHHKAGQAVDQVRKQGKSQLAGQKDRVVGTVGSVAHALRETSKQLKQSNDAPVADYLDHVAGSVEQFSNYLRQRDVDGLIGETESFARRQPALFLGGAFVLGLVAARFLKSSRPEPAQVTSGDDSQADAPRGAAATGPFSG